MSELIPEPIADSSRRSLLKKGLVAGGVAWTAPVIATLNQPVAAALGSVGGSFTYCFDAGTSEGWTIDNGAGVGGGLWNVSNGNSVSGGFSIHYGTGAGGDYDTGARNSGSITSPSFTVPTTGSQDLIFEVWREVETFASGTWDELSLSILPSGTGLYSVSRDGGTGGLFETITIDLSGFAGTTVQLAFFFDTGDQNFNGFEGIYIDNITVPGATAPGGGAGTLAQSRSLGGPGWSPDRPEPTRQEQRRRDRIVRRENFDEGVVEDGDLQAGVKSGQ